MSEWTRYRGFQWVWRVTPGYPAGAVTILDEDGDERGQVGAPEAAAQSVAHAFIDGRIAGFQSGMRLGRFQMRLEFRRLLGAAASESDS